MINNLTKLGLSFWASAALVLVNLIWLGFWITRGDGLTHIYFLDVGHGDAIFITTPNHRAILIDGGPSADIVTDIDALLPFWKRNLDLVILTHPHADHATGLIEVAKRYHIDNFLYNPAPYDTHTIAALYNVIGQQGATTEAAVAGMTQDFGSCRLNILYIGTLSGTLTDINDTSIVSQFSCGGLDILLPADIGVDIEGQLIEDGLVDDIEVLKVGHQGSRYSTSQNWLNVLDPEVAVLTVGKNNFGHPHQDTLDKLKKSGASIFSTLEHGTVEIVTDGKEYLVKAKNM